VSSSRICHECGKVVQSKSAMRKHRRAGCEGQVCHKG
jgi:hypothetical protein